MSALGHPLTLTEVSIVTNAEKYNLVMVVMAALTSFRDVVHDLLAGIGNLSRQPVVWNLLMSMMTLEPCETLQ